MSQPGNGPAGAPEVQTVAALVEATTWERARGWRPSRRGLLVAGLLVLALIVLVVFALLYGGAIAIILLTQR